MYSRQNSIKNASKNRIEEGYFEFENSNFEKQSGELKAKLELKANLT